MPNLRVAIVTGCAEGIGRGIALRLAEDRCNLVLNDLPEQSQKLKSLIEEIKSRGRAATQHTGDVSVEKDVQELVGTAVSSFGGLDIMVANAGIGMVKSILDTSLEDLDRTFNVNMRGVFLSYKYAAAQMIKQGRGGRIIGACSTGGKVGKPFIGAYSASKFAVRGLTQSAAQEWGAHGITVNTYSPGLIWTSLSQRVSLDIKSRGIYGDSPETGDTREIWERLSAMKRFGQVEDIANVVSFLASEKSSFITGQSITADGGTQFD